MSLNSYQHYSTRWALNSGINARRYGAGGGGRSAVNGVDVLTLTPDFVNEYLNQNLRMQLRGPSSPELVSASVYAARTHKRHRPIPGHAIAAVGAVKSSPRATPGGKRAWHPPKTTHARRD